MNFIANHAQLLLRIIGFANLALLVMLTPLYSGDWLWRMAPTLFSDAGIFLIGLWGLVYLAVSEDPARYVRLFTVLALEKAFYAVTWITWMRHNHQQLPSLFDADPIAGAFYAGYGLWDGACAVVLLVLWRHFSRTEAARNTTSPGN